MNKIPRQHFTEGEKVRDSSGRKGVIYTDEAGGFVRVMFEGETVDSLVDVGKLRRIKKGQH